MTARKTVISRLGAGAATLAVFGLLGVAPADAAGTVTLYTVDAPKTGPYNISTIDPTTVALTHLGTSSPDTESVDAVELYGDIGYALGKSVATGPVIDVVRTFDHNTGALLTSFPLSENFIEADIEQMRGLDTLDDGTLVAVAEFDTIAKSAYLVSIDPATGIMDDLVDLTGAADFYDSVATDPTTGTTYVFVDEDEGDPQLLTLDIPGGTYVGPVTLTGIQDAFGDGYVDGADFDSTGVLWFYYQGDDALLAATSEPFSATAGADAAGILTGDIVTEALAVGPPVVKPALAATGLDISGIAAGSLALLAAGALVVAATRRRMSTD